MRSLPLFFLVAVFLPQAVAFHLLVVVGLHLVGVSLLQVEACLLLVLVSLLVYQTE